MTNRKLSIIIPCYNEEKTVGTVIKRLLSISFDGWEKEIIVVNDGSTDGTATVLNNFSSDAKVINLVKNRGKGGAVKEGIGAATGDFAVIQDADLECDPGDIALLLGALVKFPPNSKNAIMGSREMKHDKSGIKTLSRYGSLSITKLINLLYGTSLTDTLMCYKLFPRAAFGYFQGGGFEGEMLFLTRLLQEGYHITEVPVSYTPRGAEEGKKINYRHGIKIIVAILGFWIKGLLGINSDNKS